MLIFKAEYKKQAAGDKQLYTLGIETADIQQALIADKLASNVRDDSYHFLDIFTSNWFFLLYKF